MGVAAVAVAVAVGVMVGTGVLREVAGRGTLVVTLPVGHIEAPPLVVVVVVLVQ